MTQEFEQRRRREAYQGTVDLPPREPLSVNEVETIIRRAVELQVDDDLSLPTLDEKALHRVAEELGIEPGHLRRAIAEARTSMEEPKPIACERLKAAGSSRSTADVYS